MNKFILSCVSLFGFGSALLAQNNVGIGTNTPNASAALEVTSPTNNQGILVPRLTTAQRTAIAAPANGLLVYDTNFDCFFYYIAATTSWQSMCTAGTGATGATGAAGATGPTGANGTAGATGATGPSGDPGATGATGAAGTNGTNGTNGINCWDTNGNGVNDPAEDTNTDGNWNSLDCLTGIVGPTGATGATGTAGATGPTGATGANGTNGTNGATGATGATGAAGTNGTNGTNGATGATGATGTAGATGATGVTGPTGATGATGTAGTNGTNGATGATGATGTAGAAGATGATGATGPNWTITSDNFNTDGSLAIVTTVPSTITSTQMAWLLGGNATTALRQMGSTGSQPVNFITNNVERFRMTAAGSVSVNHATPVANDVFSVYGTGYAGAITSTAGVTDWPISGYSTSTFGGVYGENSGTGSGVYGIATGATTGTGVYGQNGGTATGANGVFGNYTGTTGNGVGVRGQATANTTASIGVAGFNVGTGVGTYGQSTNGVGVWGVGTAASDGTIGQAANAGAFGVWGFNTSTTGTGVVGAGNNNTSFYLTTGTGGAFSGRDIGVYARVVQDSTTLTTGVRAGGYFYTNISAYSYVGAITAAGVVRKIEGLGTVNTVVKDLSGKQVVLSAPEAPENLFEDYGVGQLYNGSAHISIDPILAKNIVVNAEHPLRVFIQLEGDCKGVYVSNKTGNGFDVTELMNGNSNVKFSWHIVANRADEVLNDGSTSKYSSERFAPAIGPQAQQSKENPEIPGAAKVIEGQVREK